MTIITPAPKPAVQSPFLDWLSARIKEPTSWLGIAAFCASTGSGLAAAGLVRAGLIVGAIGAGFGGVGAFIAKEMAVQVTVAPALHVDAAIPPVQPARTSSIITPP